MGAAVAQFFQIIGAGITPPHQYAGAHPVPADGVCEHRPGGVRV